MTDSPLYLLDIDTFSYYIRGDHPSVERRIHLAPGGSIALSVIVEAEVLAGPRALPFMHPLHETSKQALRQFKILNWDRAAAQVYADIAHLTSNSNLEIGEMDMLIAAHAIALNLTLVSNNTRHFTHLGPALKLENWATS